MKLSEPVLAACAATALLLGALPCAAAAPQDLTLPLHRPALMLPRPQAAAILGVTTAGARRVAVGERGIVLLSDDRGRSWRQAQVPVSVTLTAARFVDARHGFATGHGGVVLASSDAGEHWAVVLDGQRAAALALDAAQALADRQGADDPLARRALAEAQRLVADGPDKPFLDLHFQDAQHGFVVGAYGLAFATSDGGQRWRPLLQRLDNPKGLHLNAIAGAGSHVVIAGEQGLLLRSDDGGASFTREETPYRGSWFALQVQPGGELLLGGLRGNAYLSPGRGAGWRKVTFPEPVSITAFQPGAVGEVYASNQAGVLYASRDAGRSFAPTALRGGPQSAAFVLDDEGVVFAGLRGLQRVEGTVQRARAARP